MLRVSPLSSLVLCDWKYDICMCYNIHDSSSLLLPHSMLVIVRYEHMGAYL